MDKNNPDELSFAFKLTVADYRRMMYFNTFSRQPRQTKFLFIAWVIALSLILLEQFAVIAPLEKVTHGCLLLVSALIPVLVATAEFAVYRFKNNHPEELLAERIMTFTEEGVEQTRDDRNNAYFEDWDEFEYVYETSAMFIFYRSARQITLLPKRAVPPDELSAVRKFLNDKIAEYRTRKGPKILAA